MNKIGGILVSIVAFVVASIGIDFMNAVLLSDNIVGWYLLANFPGGAGATFLDRYISYISVDTLGWLTYIFLGASQNLETLASTLSLNPLAMFVPGIPVTAAQGYIPMLMEYNPVDYTGVFTGLLGGLLKLVVPLIVTGIVAGLVAKTKKWALLTAIISFVVIGVIGVILNVVHVQMNWVSVNWKFFASLQVNPLFQIIWLQYGIMTNDVLMYTANFSIVVLLFAIINGVIMGILAVAVARKK